MLFLETGSPAKSLSTKNVILSTCFCLRYLSAALGFPTRYRAARFNGTKSNSRGSHILWAKWLFQQDPIYHGPSMKVSCKQICIVVLHLSSESDSVFRLTPVLSCSLSRGVLTASVLVLHPDSLTMSGACLQSGSMSRYCPV